MKLLMALALASLPLPALAQAPAAADTDGKTAAGVQYVQPKDWTATTRGPAVLFVSPEKDLRAVVVDVGAAADGAAAAAKAWRSEERRVGKEGVSTCSSRWSPYH